MSEENYGEDKLISLEQIDRDSPELWSEQSKRLSITPICSMSNVCFLSLLVPGLSEYINKNSTEAPLPAHGFTAADLQQVQRK